MRYRRYTTGYSNVWAHECYGHRSGADISDSCVIFRVDEWDMLELEFRKVCYGKWEWPEPCPGGWFQERRFPGAWYIATRKTWCIDYAGHVGNGFVIAFFIWGSNWEFSCMEQCAHCGRSEKDVGGCSYCEGRGEYYYKDKTGRASWSKSRAKSKTTNSPRPG